MEISDAQLLKLLWAIPRLKFELLDGFWKQESARLLNKSQERTLLAVKMHGDKSMTELSKYTGVEKGSFTHIVDKLETMDYLSRRPDTADKRKISLELTAKGKAYVSELDADIRKYYDTKFKVLSAAEREQFFHACNTIISLMEKILH
ncbi:MAG TPA: winged helix DNA-binding protein [Firmicutes bacterium]|nr:winged helix DNA-binding protein [Bacillota bacterium]